MQQSADSTLSYSDQQDILNTQRMREVLAELPRFCRQYFRGIEHVTSARTRLAYAYDLRVFFNFIRQNNPSLQEMQLKDFPVSLLGELEKEDLEEYLEYLSYYEKDGQVYTNDERGKSRKMSAVRSLFHYFYQAEMIDKDITQLVPSPKLHEKPITRLDTEEIGAFLDEVDSGSDLTGRQRAFHQRTRTRDLAMLTLMLGTGIRVSECVGLDLNDLDFKQNAIRVHRKGGNESIVYFGEEVEGPLQDWIAERRLILPADGSENALFLSLQRRRISVRAVEKLVKKYAQRVTTLKHITPHKLRSTYGTALYEATGDIYLVADVLGHRDVNTTRAHYAAVGEEHRKKAAGAVQLRRRRTRTSPATDHAQSGASRQAKESARQSAAEKETARKPDTTEDGE